MGYVGEIGSSKFVPPDTTEYGIKPAPKAPIRLPQPVKVPPPPAPPNSSR